MRLVACKLSKWEAWVACDADCDLVVEAAQQHLDFEVADSSVSFLDSVREHELFLLLDVKSAQRLLGFLDAALTVATVP